MGPAEFVARDSSSSLSAVSQDPTNAPIKLIQLLFQSLGHHGAFWLRLPSVAFCLVFIAAFYYLASKWFGKLVAAFASLMLVGTPWLILISRSITANVLLLSPLVLFALYKRVSVRDGQSNWAWFGLVILVIVALYIPGIFWLLVISAIILRRRITALVKASSNTILISAFLLGLILISPLVLAIIKDINVLKHVLLIPSSVPNVVDTLRSIGWSLLALFWRTRQHLDVNIGRLPMLDVTQIALIAFGGYAMWAKARRELYLMLSLVGIAAVFAGLNQDELIMTLALPALALLTAAGLRYLYLEWRSVFPRNPLPRALALVLISTMVLVHLFYGVRYALVAWPNTIDTRTTYVLK